MYGRAGSAPLASACLPACLPAHRRQPPGGQTPSSNLRPSPAQMATLNPPAASARTHIQALAAGAQPAAAAARRLGRDPSCTLCALPWAAASKRPTCIKARCIVELASEGRAGTGVGDACEVHLPPGAAVCQPAVVVAAARGVCPMARCPLQASAVIQPAALASQRPLAQRSALLLASCRRHAAPAAAGAPPLQQPQSRRRLAPSRRSAHLPSGGCRALPLPQGAGGSAAHLRSAPLAFGARWACGCRGAGRPRLVRGARA
jgi:hypothetical protein